MNRNRTIKIAIATGEMYDRLADAATDSGNLAMVAFYDRMAKAEYNRAADLGLLD